LAGLLIPFGPGLLERANERALLLVIRTLLLLFGGRWLRRPPKVMKLQPADA
jgi:uncharacterized membrane protein